MGGEVTLTGTPRFEVLVGGTDEVESIELRRGRDVVDVYPASPGRPRAASKVRVSWGGMHREGRSRDANWSGQLTCSGTTIVAAEPYGFDTPTERLTDTGTNHVAWRSGTVGDVDGVVIELSPPDEGTLSFDADLLRTTVDLADLTGEPRRIDIDRGLGMHVTFEREPEGVGRIVETTLSDSEAPAGISAYYVVVTQRDGSKAWSSPIWVTQQ
jgi:hypothetical protein